VVPCKSGYLQGSQNRLARKLARLVSQRIIGKIVTQSSTEVTQSTTEKKKVARRKFFQGVAGKKNVTRSITELTGSNTEKKVILSIA
jgi:hypothetical protein